MITSVRWKLVGTYLIMIALTVLLTNWLAYTALKQHYLQERQEAYLVHASVVSTFAANYIDGNNLTMPIEFRTYGENVGARILLLDRQGIVVNDSFNEKWVVGRQLGHNEVQAALTGVTAAGAHALSAEEWVMYVAVPVTWEKEVVGAVMLSTDINDIKEALHEVLKSMAVLSMLGSVLALMVGLWLAAKVTKPVEDLSFAVERVAAGNFNEPVPVRSRDELGQLTKSFNSMAEKLANVDRSRREFIANASHELKSPLSSIKALAESLIYSNEQDVTIYKEYLGDINDEIDRLNRVVHDLLQLAKMEDEVTTLNIEAQSVQKVIDQVIHLLKPKAKAKDITLQVTTADQLLWPVDEDMLAMILLNLVDNGIKYTAPGGQVTVNGNTVGDTLELQVSDSGEGIPAADLPHIFDRFYRVDKARSRDTGGTGLGLSIVQQAVKVLGGTISVESQVGIGTKFTVKLDRQ
ncbi:HAMP domain-containing sensor histidine kinase [Peptococcaceae bacterium 1198_IL3148]